MKRIGIFFKLLTLVSFHYIYGNDLWVLWKIVIHIKKFCWQIGQVKDKENITIKASILYLWLRFFKPHLAKMTLNNKKSKRILILTYVEAFWKNTSNLLANQTCPSVLFRNLDLKVFILATWLFLKHFSVFLFSSNMESWVELRWWTESFM